MKNILIILSFALALGMQGQSLNVGAKGGLNFGSTGDLTAIGDDLNQIVSGDSRIGFHIGAHARLQFAGIYILGETVFTRLTTGFDEDGIQDATATLSKIDTPILLGVKIIGPLSINAGPNFQFILTNNIDGISDIDLDDPENQLAIGFQAGARLQLKKLGIDLRYEGFFNDNPAFLVTAAENVSGIPVGAVDSKPNQIILSVSYDFFDLLHLFSGGK